MSGMRECDVSMSDISLTIPNAKFAVDTVPFENAARNRPTLFLAQVQLSHLRVMFTHRIREQFDNAEYGTVGDAL